MHRPVPPRSLFLTAPWPSPAHSCTMCSLHPSRLCSSFSRPVSTVFPQDSLCLPFQHPLCFLFPPPNWILNEHCPLPTSPTVGFERQLCVYATPIALFALEAENHFSSSYALYSTRTQEVFNRCTANLTEVSQYSFEETDFQGHWRGGRSSLSAAMV